MQQIAATGITDVILSVDTIILKNTQATGKSARNAETPLKRRYMSFMARMNSISKSLKILPPTYLPNVRGAVSSSLWDMTAIQAKEANTFVKNVPTRKRGVSIAEEDIELQERLS
jgi:hypothetical protein